MMIICHEGRLLPLMAEIMVTIGKTIRENGATPISDVICRE
jgi:hypothetical protein